MYESEIGSQDSEHFPLVIFQFSIVIGWPTNQIY
jgi:hypothetical protein